MAIIKRAKNMIINVRDTHTTICGNLEIIAESITITSTKEDLVLASNKRIIVEGKNGGIKFGEYVSLTPEIVDIKWMNEDMTKEITHYAEGDIISLLVSTKNYKVGETIYISVEKEYDKEVDDNKDEFVFTGIVDNDGYARLKLEIKTKEIEA